MAEGGQPRRFLASASSGMGSGPRREESPSSSLPTWMKSAIARFSAVGYAERNTGMESLKSYCTSLNKYVPVQKEHMMHVIGGCFCPVLTLYGTPRFHSSNGLFVANMVDVVYVSCPSCVLDKKMALTTRGGFVDMIVPGSEESGHPWVAFNEESYTRVVEVAARTKDRTHPAKKVKTGGGQ
jgi:hypothetical protein